MNLADEKKRARGEAAKLRNEAHAVLKDSAGAKLAARDLPFARQPDQIAVSAFFPYQSEIDTRPLLAKLSAEGWETALPVVMGKGLPLTFRVWRPGEPTVSGIWGIRIPAEGAKEVEPDLLLVPMLAFDRAGYRLGYGGGFYDRTLTKLRGLKRIVAIGVSYSAQEMDHVPRGPYDQPLDFIMTEKETFACG